jgi:uncharacterized repeat protein (TIGR01451 family)
MSYQKTLLAFFVFFVHFLQAQTNWERVPGPEGITIKSIKAIGNTLFCSSGSRILKSTDGNTWSESLVKISTIQKPYKFRLVTDNNRIIAVNDSLPNQLYYSNNLGQTWDSIVSGFEVKERLAFRADTIIKVGTNNISRSTNFGQTWLVTQTFSASNQVGAAITIGANGILVATDTRIFHSNNNGNTWTSTVAPFTLFANNFDKSLQLFQTSSALFLVVNQLFSTALLYRSIDNGQTWTLVSQDFTFIHDVVETQGKTLITAENYIFSSSNGGATWTDFLPNYSYPYEMVVVNNRLYCSTFRGIFLTDNLGQLWTSAQVGLDSENGIYKSVRLVGRTQNRIFGISSTGLFYRTENEGLTWIPMATGSGFNDFTRFWSKGDTLLLTGEWIYRSLDGGLTWTQMADFLSYPHTSYGASVFFCDGGIVGTMRSYSAMFKSTDMGVTWMELPQNFSEWDYLTSDGTRFFTSTSWQAPGVSQDCGQSYEYPTTGLPNNVLNGIWATNEGKVFAANARDLYKLNGNNWQKVANEAFFLTNSTNIDIDKFTQEGNIILANRINNPELLISKDGGNSWSNIGNSLPDSARTLSSLLFNNSIYISQRQGVTGIFKRPVDSFNAQSFSGLVYEDTNGNGQLDAGEGPLENVKIHLKKSNAWTVSKANGGFQFSADLLPNDSLEARHASPYATVTTSPLPANAGGTFLLGVRFTPNVHDLAVDLSASSAFRPGFETELFLTVNNAGTTASSGNVNLVFPNSVEILSAQPPANSGTGQVRNWVVSALPAFENQPIKVKVKTNSATPLGTLLSFTSNIQTTGATDAALTNNTSELSSEVVGSFDPNDKACTPTSLTPTQAINKLPLAYTIRFQNTGNFPASIVRIVDTLDAQFDLGSISILSSSHAVRWALQGANELEFIFDDINLPDAVSNEAGSHGFVKFQIKTKNSLPLGASLFNKAHIYFDFNAPIVTNTVQTQVKSVSTTKEILQYDFSIVPTLTKAGNEVFVHPNENLKAPFTLELMDNTGRLLLAKLIESLPFSESIAVQIPRNIPSGVYIIGVKKESFVLRKRIVLME